MFEDRIAKGIEILNERKPNWQERINLDTFAMSDCYYCVLGQLFWNYHEGKNCLGLSAVESVEKGFTLPLHEEIFYQELTDEWKKAIRENPIKSE